MRVLYYWYVPWQGRYASTTVRGFYDLALSKARAVNASDDA